MTAIRLNELRESRQGTANPPSITLVYALAGTNDPAYARTLADGTIPTIVASLYGVLYREDLVLDPIGFELWRVTAPFTQRKYALGEYRLRFSTTGGQIHITQAIQERRRYGPGAVNNAGTIGYRSADEIDGTEIVIPALKISCFFRHPQGVMTIARIKTIARATGAVNNTPFLTFLPGEVLFLGADGGEGTQTEAEVEYQFAMSENATGLTIGSIAGVAKLGWEYLWIKYKDNVVGGKPVKEAEAVYVDQVYKELPLATVLGFGA